MKHGLNIVGPQVRELRVRRGWTQPVLCGKLQLLGWVVSRTSLAKLEAQLRRVPDCEVMFLARVLRAEAGDLFPKGAPLKQVGSRFQTGRRRPIFPTRGER